jgi:hypothetical protein
VRPRKARYVPAPGTLEPTADDDGIASGRKSSGRMTSPGRRCHRRDESEPTAQIPIEARRTPATDGASSGAKKSANAGSATTSATRRNASVAITFPSQIALRSEVASTSPSSAPASLSGDHARPSPRSAVKTSATQSSP